MTDILSPDGKERALIAADLATNFLVEAGAGSGKTTSLITRMLNLIKTGKWSVGEIAAITFTRKAAAELKERFQVELEREFRENRDPGAGERLGRALMDMDQGYIGTIHSFCSRLLRERPVEAGLDPDFRELEELEDAACMEEAWQRHLTEVKLYRPHLLENINEVGISLENVRKGFFTLVNYPDLDLVYARVEKPDLRPALKALETLIQKARPLIPRPPKEKRYDELQLRLLRAQRQFRYFDLSRDAVRAHVLAPFDRTTHKVTQKLWLDKPSAKEIQEEFNLLGGRVIHPVMESWREYCHYPVMEFLLPGIRGYQEAKERESLLNYQDLLMKAAGMLREYPEVRQYFRDRYKCLLVDEFQDTDPLQSEIMFYLTGEDLREKDWLKIRPRPGSLFVVGDPKQSIYRFRRADIDTYNLVKEKIARHGGQILTLRANFRSLTSIGDFTNQVFKNLLAPAENPYQALYRPMECQRPDPPEGEYGIRVLEIGEEFTKKEEIILEDARRIAAFIRAALDGDPRAALPPREAPGDNSGHTKPRDFMILLRYKDSMEVYARALEEAGVPAAITGGSSLKDSREMDEFLQVARTVADPGNPVHLAAALRGMFFGISDDELYRFARDGGTFNFLKPLPPGMEEEILKTFESAFSRLLGFYRDSRACLPSVALGKMASDLGLLPFALSEPLGTSKGGLLLQVLEHLARAESRGITSFAGLVSHLETLQAAGLEEELSLAPGGEEAVRLMNLHKAKGLEAPVVFLAHPWKRVRFTPDLHVSRTGPEPGAYFAFSDEWSGKAIAQPLNWQAYREEEEKYQDAEETRLVYVAATRAKDLLVISKSLKDPGMRRNPWQPLLEKVPDGLCLPDPLPIPPPSPAPGPAFPAQSLMQARKAFSAWNTAPGFTRWSPSSGGEDKEGGEVLRAGGGGAAWGSVIHRVLEAVVRGREDLEELTERALLAYGLAPEKKEEVFAYLQTMQESPLWQRIQKSQTRMAEVPFIYRPGADHPAFDLVDPEPPVLLSGIIDLAFKEEDGWVIVDYKTDRVEDAASLEILVERYRPQVRAYAAAFQDLTGEKVKSAEIYFLHTNQNRQI